MKEELFVAPVNCLHSEITETITVFACSVQEALKKIEDMLRGTSKFVITNEIALREPSVDDFEI